MYIIAGLGNPTAQYRGTRHNVGFEVIDYLADKYNIDVTTKKFKGLIGTGAIEGQKVALVKPQTFMNLSGECIQEVMNYYKTDISDLIVVYDDINLEPGQLRVRGKGSAGGHNGMKNIILHCNSQDFPRVRVGIGAKPLIRFTIVDFPAPVGPTIAKLSPTFALKFTSFKIRTPGS